MGKIVCEVCGTSYSDAATQCPICGYVSPMGTDISAVANNETTSAQPKYEYVKGGRFSKANVKKRNMQKTVAVAPAAKEPINKKTVEQRMPAPQENQKSQKKDTKKKDKNSGSNKGLVITVLVLLLAIIAVIAYIAVTFVLPVVMPSKDMPQADTLPSEIVVPTAVQGVLCTDIVVEPAEVILNAVGETAQITTAPVPANVTDTLTFASGNPAVATVDENGLVTAVGAGYTEVTVSCGEITVSCVVTVYDEMMEFVFDKEEVTLASVGEEAVIYSGTIPVTDIAWSSEDEQIATVHDGIVVAVGSGTTTVYGEYKDMIISCVVTCTVAEETEPTEPTQDLAAIEANGPYHLHNPHGTYDTDASIKVGVSFTLYLLDKNDEIVKDVKWSVENGSSCKVDNGKVTGIAKGNCDVVATYGGKTYTCIVRVS